MVRIAEIAVCESIEESKACNSVEACGNVRDFDRRDSMIEPGREASGEPPNFLNGIVVESDLNSEGFIGIWFRLAQSAS